MNKEKQINEITNELIFTKNYGTLDAVAKHLYESGYRKQEWISVEDRLPENSYQILIYLDNGNIEVGYYDTDDNKFHHILPMPRVTHWMPLPPPPKMKGGAE